MNVTRRIAVINNINDLTNAMLDQYSFGEGHLVAYKNERDNQLVCIRETCAAQLKEAESKILADHRGYHLKLLKETKLRLSPELKFWITKCNVAEDVHQNTLESLETVQNSINTLMQILFRNDLLNRTEV